MYASVKLQFTNEKSPLDEVRPSVKLQVTYGKKPLRWDKTLCKMEKAPVMRWPIYFE